MNMPQPRNLAAALALLAVAACATAPSTPDGAAAVREKLTQLQADPQLANRAPVALKDAETAVRTAEIPTDDPELARHRVVMADRKVEIARALSQGRYSEDQIKTLAEQRDTARLDSRTREADSARADATLAQREAAAARSDADLARSDTAQAQQESADLQRQLADLDARATDRGLVVTLGDVLFATGGSTLKGTTPANLGKLAGFLKQYPDRTIVIEGHTDSVGSADANDRLSQRRADAVKAYLLAEGVDSSRITATGMGESSPVASNDSVTGRQQNRRVEVVISNTVASR